MSINSKIIFIAFTTILAGCTPHSTSIYVEPQLVQQISDQGKYKVCFESFTNCTDNLTIIETLNEGHHIFIDRQIFPRNAYLVYDGKIVNTQTLNNSNRIEFFEKILLVLIGFFVSIFTTFFNRVSSEWSRKRKLRKKLLRIVGDNWHTKTDSWTQKFHEYKIDTDIGDNLSIKISTLHKDLGSDKTKNQYKRDKRLKKIISKIL